ncbi:MAG: ACP S-malonyltransferase [Dehalococcoidia bacterium]|nr:MAG: ACP S-malonyltransferase [Dehalococcoidia bacterium]
MVELGTASTRKVACIFPGQGSQAVGMGYSLYESSRQAKEVFKEADEALQFHISQLCFEGPEEVLRDTINAQPAILTTSIACLRAASEFGAPLKPVVVAGHSLGEYTALVAADVISFTDAVILVRERGRLMHEAGKAKPGGMAAIIGLDEVTLEEVCRETGSQIANFNCSGQIVISGTRESLARSMDLAKARGARRVIPLQVSGAFHSVLMQPTVEGMTQAISQVDFKHPSVPVIANSTAQPLTSADEVKDELIRQLCNCVQWQPSVEYMLGAGVSTFIEIGPGQVLTGLIRKISNEVQVFNMSDPDSINAINM